MIQLSYLCNKIREAEDFKRLQADVVGKRQYCQNFGTSVLDSWNNLYNYLKPGRSMDGTVALEIRIIAEGMELYEQDADTFTELVLSGLEDSFGARQVLSMVREKGNPITCIAVVFPLDKRVPNAEKYLNKIFPQYPNDKVKAKIERRVHSKFSEVLITGESASVDKSNLGYMPALIDYSPAPYRKEYDTVLTYHVVNPDDQVQTMLPYDKMNAIVNKVITYYTAGPEKLLFERSQRQNGDVTPEDFMEKVSDYVKRMYPEVKGNDFEILKFRIFRAVFRNYILEPLIDADDISDIMVLSPYDIRVKIGGERYTSDAHFIDAADYYRFIFSLGIRNGLDIANNAINVFSDTTSNVNFRMRFNITTPYINSSEYPYLHIRKIAKKKRGLDYLIRAGMLDETIAAYLVDKARNGKGMIFTGKGASGKTTLMNMLLDKIPFDKSGLVIQESEELFSDVHPHLMFEHIVTNQAGGKKYDLQDLARNGLLTDLDYFVIGEVKDAEAKYFINAADTGHRCWCSVHSPSSTDAIDKLADYVMYETNYSKEEATYMLKDLGTVIFMSNFKVVEISEIAGYDHKERKLIYTPIYRRPGIMG